jgi:hypothetical protein
MLILIFKYKNYMDNRFSELILHEIVLVLHNGNIGGLSENTNHPICPIRAPWFSDYSPEI